MRGHSDTVLLSIALCLAGCAKDVRSAASELSRAGLDASTVLRSDVDARVLRLGDQRASQDFVAAYDVLRRCPSISHGSTTDPNCDTATLAQARATSPVNVQIAALAAVIAKRSRALTALGSAYAALGDEAAYDEAGDVAAAIGPAIAAANDFGAAVGLGPLPAVVGRGVDLFARSIAGEAQRRRLIRDSRTIAQVTRHIRLALVRERDLFGALDALLADLDGETRRTMLAAGLLDPGPAVRSIASGAAIPIREAGLGQAMASDHALGGAAEVATLDATPLPSSGDLDAGIGLLVDLEAQHAAFERRGHVDPGRLAADAGRLGALANATGR